MEEIKDRNGAATPKKTRRFVLKFLRVVGRVLAAIILLLVAVVGALYIPGVLNFLAGRVLPSVEQSSGLHIETENISLRWPLKLAVDGALVTDLKANGDTMIAARSLQVDLNPLPLMAGRLSVSRAEIRDGLYRMGGADSLFINVEVDSIGAAATMALNFATIAVDHADLNGARVRLLMGPDTTATPVDTTPTAPMLITSGPITLKNVDYTMSMALTNDTIAARVSQAALTAGRLLVADTIDIRAGVLTMAVDSALYGTRGVTPLAGLDLSWLTLRNASAAVDSFAMHGTEMRVPLRQLTVGNVADMSLQANGVFEMTSAAMLAHDFTITLNDRTRLTLDAEMGMLADASKAPVRLDATAEVFTDAVVAALPAFRPLLAPLPAETPLRLRAYARGTMADLRIDTLAASMNGIFAVEGAGTAGNLTSPDSLTLNADIEGRLVNSAPLKSMMPAGVTLPPLTLQGHATALGGNYSARLTARTGAGRLALNGSLRGSAPAYSIDLRADSFPVGSFMPDMGIGAVSATFRASGRSLNPLQRGAQLNAAVNVGSLQLRGDRITDLRADATLADGALTAAISSGAPAADFNLDLDAALQPKTVGWKLRGNVRNLDLKALGLTDSILTGRMALRSEGFAALNLDTVSADATLLDARLQMNSMKLALDSLTMTARAGSQIAVDLGNRTLNAAFRADTTLNALTADFVRAAGAATEMIDRRDFLADSLISLLPPMNLTLNARPGSVLEQFVEPSGIKFRTLDLSARTDTALHAQTRLLGLASGESLAIDTLTLRLLSRGHALLLDADIDNRPGTLDEFAHVCLRGGISGRTGRFFIEQQNLRGVVGYRLGLRASVADSVITVNFDPTEPTIAYKQWTINADNFLSFNPSTFHIDANLDARGAGSRLQLLSSESSAPTDSLTPNNVALKVSDVHIQDWLQLNPFAPPIAGDVNADLTVNYSTKSVNGSGTLGINNLTYGRQSVGSFDMDLDIDTDFGGAIWANAGLNVNGRRALVINGALNDTTTRTPLSLAAQITSLPLAIANPFLPREYAELSGALNGYMEVDGTLSAPVVNGAISFNRGAVNVGMMGTTFRLDSTAIAVDSNLVAFNNFAIFGANDNPLRVNGSVNMRNFASPAINLDLRASNMQFLNSKKGSHINLYGRGFIDLDAQVRGNMKFLSVDTRLAILPTTNLTYQITSARAAVGLEDDSDVVKFVNFADTAQVALADTVEQSAMAMALTASVDIRQGSQFTVDLSTDGQNRAQLKPQGILTYSMSPAQPDGRLIGRLTIDGGFFRYSLPVISEKTFNFASGSYVAFNGPVMNPTLNISATDQTRANVTRPGENSRLVNFDVTLLAKGTPEHLDVSFDLSTNDDLSLQNELQAMSPTQRANKAMNLLLYGMYSSGETSATSNLSGNALYGFLSSQLNKWAANTIKGVDVSFGFDQFDRTRNGQTSTATQYSYKVSKSLFNDRFKIIVGGNYSTDTEESDIAENLISDVSLEYMLNQSGSMYVRLFRHTGYESILEGEVTQTGVGFVIKRRVNRVADIFNFRKAVKQ